MRRQSAVEHDGLNEIATNDKNGHLVLFYEKVVFENFAKSTGKQLC